MKPVEIMQRRHYPRYAAGAVAVLVFALYLPALQNEFVLWDDDRYVYNNFHIRSLGGSFFGWAATDVSEHFWQPLAWLYHAIDYALWGLNPVGHHLTSNLLHGVNAFLVVVLLVRILEEAGKVRRAAGEPHILSDRSMLIAGCVAGLLFGGHPLQVESVAWVTGKHDLLFAFFFLLSVMAYTDYAASIVREGVPQGPKPFFFNKKYLLSLFFFVLSLSSKPSAVVLPAVLMVLDWQPFRRLRSGRDFVSALIEKLPFLVLSIILSVSTIVTHQARGGMATLESTSLMTRLLVTARALVLYFWNMLVPLHLGPFYPYPKDVSFGAFAYLSSVMLLFVITAACIVLAKRRPMVSAVWLYFLLGLLPVLGIFKVRDVFMADRYMYLPCLGPFLLAGVGAGVGWDKISSPDRRKKTLYGLSVALAVVLCAAMGYLTVKQVAIWKNSITLWSRVIELDPVHAPNAYVSRGWAFREAGQIDLALADFDRAIALDTAPPYLAYNNRGIIYRDKGELNRAVAELSKAVTMDPEPFLALSNRGIAFGKMGRLDDAMEDFSQAISLNPAYVDAYIGRGMVLQEMGRLDNALGDLNTAIKLMPYNGDAYVNRGVVYERMGLPDRAAADYGKAIEVNRSDYLAYRNRGALLAGMGTTDRAIEDYSRALAFNPELPDLYVERGDLYLRIGNRGSAAADYRTACGLGSEAGCRKLRMHE